MKPRSLGTTLILVVVLLGGLVMVSARVNPKPPGPEPEAPKQPQTPPEEAKKQELESRKEMMSQMANRTNKPEDKKAIDDISKSALPDSKKMAEMKKLMEKQSKEERARPKNPDTIEVTSDYWKSNSDGVQGTQKLDAEVTKQRDAYRKSVNFKSEIKPASEGGASPKIQQGMEPMKGEHDGHTH